MATTKRARGVDWHRRYLDCLDGRVRTVNQKVLRIAELQQQVPAEKTSVEFWIYEAPRWRGEAENLRRADAVKRIERGER